MSYGIGYYETKYVPPWGQADLGDDFPFSVDFSNSDADVSGVRALAGCIDAAAGIGQSFGDVVDNADFGVNLYNRIKTDVDNRLTGQIFHQNRDVLAPHLTSAEEIAGYHSAVGALENGGQWGEVGMFGFLKKAWKSVKKKVAGATPKFIKKIVNKVVNWQPVQWATRKVKQFATWVEKASRNPAFTGIVFAITQAVPGGQAAGYAFLAIQAARTLVGKLASGDLNGVAMATADIAMLANSAAGGNILARSTLDAVEAVKKEGLAGAAKVVADFPIESLPPDVQAAVQQGKDALAQVKSRVADAQAAAATVSQTIQSAVTSTVPVVSDALRSQYADLIVVSPEVRNQWASLL